MSVDICDVLYRLRDMALNTLEPLRAEIDKALALEHKLERFARDAEDAAGIMANLIPNSVGQPIEKIIAERTADGLVKPLDLDQPCRHCGVARSEHALAQCEGYEAMPPVNCERCGHFIGQGPMYKQGEWCSACIHETGRRGEVTP